MKVCLLTNTYRPHVGGVARSVETLEGQLREFGHEVLVVAPGFRGDRHERDPNVLRVPALQNFNGSDFSVRVPIPQLVRRRVRAFGPDLLHSQHPFLMGDTALRMSYEFNRPLVFTHHTLYENYTHYVPFDSPVLKRFAIELASEYANACDAVIAPSRSVSALLQERGVRVPVRVIPTGIDSRALAGGDADGLRARLGIPREALLIGHVGRLAAEKNLGFLAASAATALQRLPDARCLVVGDGPEGARVRREFEQQGVAERLIMTGKLTGTALVDAYAAIDLFLFCSQTETQGMVLAEAMAAGCPVVALDGPGVRDLVADGDNGRLLPGEAGQAEMSEALVEAADEARRRRWADGARATARAFDRVACTERVVDLYRMVCEQRQGATMDWNWWDRLLGRIDAEWELISSKAESAGRGLRRPPGGSPPRGSTN